MDSLDFYSDKKWCAECAEYVPYLMSIEHSYCVTCGAEVRLFSKEDWRSFSADMASRKPKGAGKRSTGKRAARAEGAERTPIAEHDKRAGRESA